MEEKMYTIDVILRTKKNNSTGAKFTNYYLKTKSGEWQQVKFAKTCDKVPTSYSRIKVKPENIFEDYKKEKKGNNEKVYKLFWIRDVEEIEEIKVEQTSLDEYFE
ncbi:hypothetical protein [Clostridium sp.]|uniref:hypothetical protein n=1 Tax=Clostridium sp. TaxID=1506 RepID=UPI0025C0EB16|nr:hypothetical protein [Clostridium sp.]